MLYAIVVVLVLIVDQGSKYLVTRNIALNTGAEKLIPGVIRLTNIHNTGASFSLLEGKDWARWFFVAVTVIFVAAVIWILIKGIIKSPAGRWTLLLIMAGAIGNGIDRLLLGYVVDMFELEFMHFPVFNVADMFITCAGIAFCLFIILGKEELAAGDKKQSVRAAAPESTAAPAAPAKMSRAERQRAQREELAELERRRMERMQRQRADAAPRASAEGDPFAEWESKPQPAVPADEGEVKVYTPKPSHRHTEHTASKPAPTPEPVPKPVQPAAPVADIPPAPEPAPAPKSAAKDDMDFSLEDILAEFSEH